MVEEYVEEMLEELAQLDVREIQAMSKEKQGPAWERY